MAPINRDDSLSPMTKSPKNGSPAQEPNLPEDVKSNDHGLLPALQLPLPDAGPSMTSETDLDGMVDRIQYGAGSPPNQSAPTSPSRYMPPKRYPTDPALVSNEPVSPGRRSVQFSRNTDIIDLPSHARTESWEGSRSDRWMSKLKATLGSSGSIQPPEAVDPVFLSTNSSPVNTRSHRVSTLHEEEGSDADVEESGGEEETPREASKPKKRKRMRRRLKQLEMLRTPQSSSRAVDDTDLPPPPNRTNGMIRRSTMPDDTDQRGGMSEGEGRDRLAGKRPGWRRGNSWMGSPRPAYGQQDEVEPATPRALGHRRRISDMFGGASVGAGGASDGDVIATPRRQFFDRRSTFGGQRWRQVKNTFRMLGKKKTDQFDYYKSAELMAELRAVTPAVVIFASMLQRDERGNKRIPVLLEQLNLRVIDSRPDDGSSSEKHSIFTIALEYGSGVSRMRWSVTRHIREVGAIHLKYKTARKIDVRGQKSSSQRQRPKQPKWPSKEFPTFGYIGNNASSDEEENTQQTTQNDQGGNDTAAEGTAGEMTNGEATGSDMDRRPATARKKSRFNQFLRRQSSGIENADGLNSSALNSGAWKRRWIDRQRKALEKYLQEMIHWLMFRPDSGRLCHFLELSALGVRLAAEGSFHGKECFLHIQSSKGIDFRRVLTPSSVIARHSRKWFLVRQNYIVVVESPATMQIYDVYLVDPTFRIVSKKSKLKQLGSKATGASQEPEDVDESANETVGRKHHTLKLYTSERKVKLFSRNQTLIHQFEQSVINMLKQTAWHEQHRFNSFAPVRKNVFAQWLVDGRDYMWNVSRAISMAQDVIYIHDWWLSPELYMRRPACISQKWRLDRLLQRKAREGVKVFVIVYRNVEQAIPIDSEYTKFSLLNLHDNIMVLRSPNQIKKNQFFYSHHEKICIVDHDVAFVGGIDLCFGRWDNPEHPLADDRPTGMEAGDRPRDAEHCQLFPGKDYSNPRVLDFFKLYEPYEEMYDRSRVPRMPWHDVSMQVVGQPARDLTRHFIQRWNYLRRERKPTRPTPFLLPPPDANPAELEGLGLSGTCEVQMLRSAGDWSLGLSKDAPEHSILSAYLKLIEESEHFVYLENQFFITSTETLNSKVVNRIGDALVERIIRAHENDEEWRACIMIPLMPGYQNTVDQAEGSSVRLIMQFQYHSICRGPYSIFGRLQAVGIDPDAYIRFFSLRQWGRIGSNNALVTEQLYIHAKTIIVDDRVALIGSANINERSMLGNRDSETAAVVRDTDMMWSTMAGQPYRVGRFAHTLRLRLMREHLGLDVDDITEEERQTQLSEEAQFEAEMARIYDEDELDSPVAGSSQQPENLDGHLRPRPVSHHRPTSFNHEALADDVEQSSSSPSSSSSSSSSSEDSPERDARVTQNKSHDADVEGYGQDRWREAQAMGMDLGSDSAIIDGNEVLIHRQTTNSMDESKAKGKNKSKAKSKGRARAASASGMLNPKNPPAEEATKGNDRLPPVPKLNRRTTEQMGLPHFTQLPSLPISDDTDIGGPPVRVDETGKPTNEPLNPWLVDIKPVQTERDCMRDPVNSSFWDGIWNQIAENNTKLYRRVFRCMPDNEVLTWKDYQEFDDYALRFKQSMTENHGDENNEKADTNNVGGADAGAAAPPASEKVHDNQNADNNPQVLVSNGDAGDALDEKAALKDSTPQQHSNGTPQPNQLAIDTENITRNRQSSSPVKPAGNIPFPSFEDESSLGAPDDKKNERRATFSSNEKTAGDTSHQLNPYNTNSVKRRRRATTKSSRRGPVFPYDVLSREEAEELCSMIQGHLVHFPYDWLEAEEKDNHWLYQADLLAPKEIYN